MTSLKNAPIEKIVAANSPWPLPVEANGRIANTLTMPETIVVHRACLLHAQQIAHEKWMNEKDTARKRSYSVAGRVLQELIVEQEQLLREVIE